MRGIKRNTFTHQSLAGGREQRGPPGAQGLSALLPEAGLLLPPLPFPGVRWGAWQQKVSQGKRGSSKEQMQTMNEAVHGHAAEQIGQCQQLLLVPLRLETGPKGRDLLAKKYFAT